MFSIVSIENSLSDFDNLTNQTECQSNGTNGFELTALLASSYNASY